MFVNEVASLFAVLSDLLITVKVFYALIVVV